MPAEQPGGKPYLPHIMLPPPVTISMEVPVSRFFAPIAFDEFKKKVQAAFNEDGDDGWFSIGLVLDHLEKDIKVSFDTENHQPDKSDGEIGPASSLLGYHQLANGMHFFGMSAGGDWEYPVFFIVYWDGKKLRGYVPTDGNPWNTDTNEAYGNDEEKDLVNVKKRQPIWASDAEEWDDGLADWFNADEVIKDITERIKPREEAAEKAVKASKGYGEITVSIAKLKPAERMRLMTTLASLYCRRCGDTLPCKFPEHA